MVVDKFLLIYVNFFNFDCSIVNFKGFLISANIKIFDTIVIRKYNFKSSYLIGFGKLIYLKKIIKMNNVNYIIFNCDLNFIQNRNLERFFSCKLLDRTDIILRIFICHAKTFESKLNIELAKLKLMLTKLVRSWTHLEKQVGGIGVKGPGEKQIEIDKRIIRSKIKNIEFKLGKTSKNRVQNRKIRISFGIPIICIVGYTNSGKSTLFNLLSNSKVFVADELFSTLDSSTKIIDLPYVGNVILIDTVGFISNLPYDIINSFRSTLEEISYSKLLLHVIDTSSNFIFERKMNIESILFKFNFSNTSVLEVYNKIDLFNFNKIFLDNLFGGFLNRVYISANNLFGIDNLMYGILKNLIFDTFIIKLKILFKDFFFYSNLCKLGFLNNEFCLNDEEWIIRILMKEMDLNYLLNKFNCSFVLFNFRNF